MTSSLPPLPEALGSRGAHDPTSLRQQVALLSSPARSLSTLLSPLREPASTCPQRPRSTFSCAHSVVVSGASAERAPDAPPEASPAVIPRGGAQKGVWPQRSSRFSAGRGPRAVITLLQRAAGLGWGEHGSKPEPHPCCA